jgi:hypothetical protein
MIALTALALGACDNSDDGAGELDVEAAFAEAAALDQTWCARMQLDAAGLAGTVLADAIELQMVETKADLTGSHTEIETGDAPVIRIYGHLEGAELSGAQRGQTVFCKTKSVDRLEASFGVDLPEQGTCQAQNAAVLAWALDRVGAAARERYEAAGYELRFGSDQLASTGAVWTATPSTATREGKAFVYASSALRVPWADAPEVPDYIEGVAYCKLLAPSAALSWVLEGALSDEPEAALVAPDDGEADCRLAEPGAAGSCIFYFQASQQHYCEDYTGPDWTVEGARERCTRREMADAPAVFSMLACAEREAETATLDDDGVFRGQCIIDCGGRTEYRWNVYSDPPTGGTAADACPRDWFE